MKKVGILTYHYSNNYGGVLQAFSLYSHIKSLGYKVEIINYIPSSYNDNKIIHNTGIRKNILKTKREDLRIDLLLKRITIKYKYNKKVKKKFDNFRKNNLVLSPVVDDTNINSILGRYDAIIVGSDQIWNPINRNKNIYFLGFGDKFRGDKISYAADSTISYIEENQFEKLKRELSEFKHISVRNEHSRRFAEKLVEKDISVVVDPTVIYDFYENNYSCKLPKEKYILVYSLGKEISGSNKIAIKKIKAVYGNIKVYAIVIPTMKFNIINYADKVLYNLGPEEWLTWLRNASFVFTDSYHGTMFSLKFEIPFLTYYAEESRATRFIDISKRYDIDKFIVSSINEIDDKMSLMSIPDFKKIKKILDVHKEQSVNFIKYALS